MMTLKPCAASSLMEGMNGGLEPMSMPLVGSSRTMTFGGCAATWR